MQFLVETDVLCDCLCATEPGSLLRSALSRGVCYTTMLNALELFREAKTPNEKEAVTNLLMVVRVLGYSARYAETFASFASELEEKLSDRLSEREVMIVGMARASKLILLTEMNFTRYSSLPGVAVIRSLEEVPIG
ncbi:MAG: hypothetical protein WCH46_05960 [bacterium]